ncbi:MAG: hypothetical protein EOQ46_26540 [Mesorhizobium sp.]|nr:MAG: hypothetical protein EOQ46_26540 [Mesorhizobium sp.]
MVSVMIFLLISLFPRSGFLPEGAGAPLLLPSSCGTAGERGQGDKSEGDHPPEAKPKGRRMIRLSGSASILHVAQPKAWRRKDGETDFLLAGRGGSAPFPHQAKELRPAPAGLLLTGEMCSSRKLNEEWQSQAKRREVRSNPAARFAPPQPPRILAEGLADITCRRLLSANVDQSGPP